MINCLFTPTPPDRTLWIKMCLICLIGMSACVGYMWVKSETENPFFADAQGYTAGFYNLYHHGVFSQSLAPEVPQPSVGREPGVAALMTLVAQFDDGLNHVTKQCLQVNECLKEWASGIQWVNRVLFALAGVFMFVTGYLVCGRLSGAVIAGGLIWLNKHMQKNMDYVISEPLALFLVCGFTLFLCLGVLRRHPLWWSIAGLFLAGLMLTKAVFFYFGLLLVVVSILVILIRAMQKQDKTRELAIGLALLAAIALTPSLLWMERNHDINGRYALADSRSGIALNHRVTLNEMSPAQYFTSFLYWTRGFGDNWARALLPQSVWDDLRIENPDGFYYTAQNGYPAKVKELQKDQSIAYLDAQQQVDRALMGEIITNPVNHALVTLPLIYRGLWVDQFAWFSVPLLIWVLSLAIRQRHYALLVILSPGLFNILFYASLSQNLVRYQVTAAPVFALALALGLLMLDERGVFDRLKRKFSRS